MNIHFVVSHAFAVRALCHDATHHDRGVLNHLPSSYERKNSTAKKLIHEKLNGDAELCTVAKFWIGLGRQRTPSDLDEAEEKEGEEGN